MKSLFTTLFTALILVAYSQAPEQISYQGVARNVSGSLLTNQNIGIKLDLHQGSSSGTIVFSESHNKTTNSFGLFTLGIGSVNTSGFTSLNWANGPYFMEVSIDPAGGTSYTSVGTQQFMSVPYALYAKTSGNSSPTPTITINAPNTVTTASGNYSINIPSSTVYTAGSGIDVTGGVISNTAPNQTVNISGSGVTGVYPNYTINSITSPTTTLINGNNITLNQSANTYTVNAPSYGLAQSGNVIALLQNGTSIGTATVPASTSYSAGTGISISSGVITNTAIAVTPTISAGNNIIINPAGASNSYTVNAPTYSLSQTGNNINLLQNGTSISTATIPSATNYSAGTGIAISSGTIINTSPAITPTITNSGIAVVTSTVNLFNVDVPTPTLTVSGNSISINPGNTQALPNYSLTQSGSNINLTQNGASIAAVSIPTTASTSLFAGNSNVLLNQSGNAYTITPVTPTFTNNGPTTISGSYPSYTINSVISPSTTLVQGNNVLLTQSGNTYTIDAPSYSLTSNTNTLTLSNGTNTATAVVTIPTQTLSVSNNSVITSSLGGSAIITPAALTYTSSSNVIKLTDGLSVNTYTLNSYAAGTGISISGVAPNYVITNTISAITPTITGIGMASVSPTVGNNFTISVPSPTYTPSTGLLNFGGTNSVIATPSLTLTGSTLTSGPATNSVNLSALSVWTNSVGVLYPSTLTNSIGIGTSGPLTDKAEINYASSPTSSHINFKQTGADAFSRIKFSNAIAPSKYWLNSVTSATADVNSGYNFYYNNGTTGRNLFTVGGDGKVSVNPFTLSYPALLEVNGGFDVDSTIAVNGLSAMPPASIVNSGKIYFDKAASKFMVSENAGAYKPLFTISPWNQGTNIVTLNNINDQVGIGTNSPGSLLDIQSTNTATLITAPILNVVNTHSTYATPTGMVNFQNLVGSGPVLYVKSATLGSGIVSVLTNTNNTSNGIDISHAGTGSALYALNTNSTSGSAGFFKGSSVSTALISNNIASGNAFDVTANIGTAINANSGGAVATLSLSNLGSGDVIQAYGATNGGRVLLAKNNSSTNSTIEGTNLGVGSVIKASKSSTGNIAIFDNSNATNGADGVLINNSGTGAALHATTTNTAGIAGLFTGKIAVKDGTEGANKILSSDATGNSSWIASPGVAFGSIISTGVDLLTAINLATLTIAAPGPGYVVVTFDGFSSNTPVNVDLILAVSNTSNGWGPNNGHTRVQNVGNGPANISFSHTQTYTISSAGSYTYYAVGLRWSGTGLSNIYGNITARFFPYKY